MIRLIVLLIVFTTGAGLGIWWGVNHPSEAVVVSSQEEIQALKIQAAAEAKIDLLNKFLSTKPADQNPADYKQMLEDEKRKLEATPPSPPAN
jgi:hypothetical protein